MTQETDDRKRPQLRLVVDNAGKHPPRPADGQSDYIPMADLVAMRDTIRPEFYRGQDRQVSRGYRALERQLTMRGWPYGLDLRHGRLLVIPAAVVCPEFLTLGADHLDELLVHLAEDATGIGLCLSLEMILPYMHEDDSVMEDALLYSPIHQYGSLFLEENRQDGPLDLIYRLAIPLSPPALTVRIIDRLFAIASFELATTLHCLGAGQEG